MNQHQAAAGDYDDEVSHYVGYEEFVQWSEPQVRESMGKLSSKNEKTSEKMNPQSEKKEETPHMM